MEKVKCKRCGHVLTNPKSIELGYGKTCYNIINLHKQENQVENDVKFLKCEIATLKRMFKQIDHNGIITIDPIERIKHDNHRPERDMNRANFSNVISELKSIFNRVNNVLDYLTPIEPRTTIELPPQISTSI